MKNKAVVLLAALIVLSALLCGCTPGSTHENAVVCAAFPQYDLARRICGNTDAEVVMLLPCGTEAHDYEPSASDIKTIAASALFIYNGGESDAWIERVLAAAPNVTTVALIDCRQSTVYEDGDEVDEHIWTSPKNALLMAEKIYNELVRCFPEHKTVMEQNYASLASELMQLDSDYEALASRLDGKTVFIGDRNPFTYLAADYGIKMEAAFHGCGHESEPSAAELARLITLAKNEGARYVFYVDFSNGTIARTIAAELENAETVNLYSCHNVTAKQRDTEGYISLMRENLTKLNGVCDAAD